MAGYFTEGRHVRRVEELADLASEIGLDRDEVVRVLDSGDYGRAVATDIAQAAAYGIRGVPFLLSRAGTRCLGLKSLRRSLRFSSRRATRR